MSEEGVTATVMMCVAWDSAGLAYCEQPGLPLPLAASTLGVLNYNSLVLVHSTHLHLFDHKNLIILFRCLILIIILILPLI